MTGPMPDRKQQVVDLLKAIKTGASEPVGVIDPRTYIQHNLAVADGFVGFKALQQALQTDSARLKTIRVFQDGEFVFAHTEYDVFGPKVGFDIFRFERGKIVEHWDNLQTAAGPNASGHTMIDGPTAPTELERTEENKALVHAFVVDILVNGRMEKLASYFNGDAYTQHNPQIADGLSGLANALAAMAKAGIALQYDRIHRVLGEGSFVLTVSEGALGAAPASFYDLFRVENGMIAEHWDTIEAIPDRNQWQSSNGKF